MVRGEEKLGNMGRGEGRARSAGRKVTEIEEEGMESLGSRTGRQ